VREFPDNVPDELLNKALAAALKATASDEPSIRAALEPFIAHQGGAGTHGLSLSNHHLSRSIYDD
jgi:hypothetical protein